LTAVLYIIFASMAGARERFDEQTEEEMPENSSSESAASKPEADNQAEQRGETGRDAVLWICGILAVASLLTCVILPIWVYATAGKQYDRNFATFKSALIWPTLIYFVTGTIWAIKRNKAR